MMNTRAPVRSTGSRIGVMSPVAAGVLGGAGASLLRDGERIFVPVHLG